MWGYADNAPEYRPRTVAEPAGASPPIRGARPLFSKPYPATPEKNRGIARRGALAWSGRRFSSCRSHASWRRRFSCCSSPPVAAAPTRLRAADAPQVSAARLEEHIRYLASDRLAGRGTGTPGYDSAARYVAKQFAALGLDSAGTKGYFQPVPLRHARAVEGSSLVLTGRPDAARSRPTGTTCPSPTCVAPRSEVTAPLVFAGFGVTAPERGYDDYRERGRQGEDRRPAHRRPRLLSPGRAGALRQTAGRSGRTRSAGARSACLVVRTRDQSFPWDRLVRQSRRGEMRWLDRNGEPADVWPAIRGAGMLSDSAAARLFEGAPRSLSEVLDAAEAGKPPAFDLPLRATHTHGERARAAREPQRRRAAARLRPPPARRGRGLYRASRPPRDRRAGAGRLHLQRRARQRLGHRRAARGGEGLRRAAGGAPPLGALPGGHRRGGGTAGQRLLRRVSHGADRADRGEREHRRARHPVPLAGDRSPSGRSTRPWTRPWRGSRGGWA